MPPLNIDHHTQETGGAAMDIYEKLRERLDSFPQGFPRTKSRVELDILRRLFSEQEADIMFYLRPYPEPVSAIADRMDNDEVDLDGILYDMSRRGLILRFKASEEEVYYFLAPWMVGIWEFQVNNLDRDNIELFEKYFEEGIVPYRKKLSVPGFRVIPVERDIKDSTEIQPYERVSEIIESNTRFAVADCICRKEAAMLGKGCDKPLETCMTFGLAADYTIENGIAREISKSEAIQILDMTEEAGLVHFSSNHAGDKIFICNCCGCCCKALAHVTRHDNPQAIAVSNYFADVDADACSGCETCIDRCQVDAIRMEDDVAVVDSERCIWCGLCVSTCPSEALAMLRKPAHASSAIFVDDHELTQARARDANKAFPFE
jgi:ferredoxin